MKPRILLSGGLLLLLISCFASTARAQVQVNLEIARHLYLIYEPLEVRVSVRNLAGRDITLRDEGGQNWFGFEITRADGGLVSTIDREYHLAPVTIAAGQTVTRKIDLTPLYALREFGNHRIRATIYVAEIDKFFSSPVKLVDITEGKTFWRQTVGVPQDPGIQGTRRTYSLLSHEVGRGDKLYVRVEDPDSGAVYATYRLGPLLSLGKPKAEIDDMSHLHVLSVSQPKMFDYSEIGLNGELIQREQHVSTKTAPRLLRNESGQVRVAGGMVYAPVAEPVLANPAGAPSGPPKLSDRPPATK